jgi:hypothetical protein
MHPCIPIAQSNTHLHEKNYSSIYIVMDEIVKLTEEDYRDAERIENDPKKILALIDLIFMYEDNKKVIPS